MPTSSSSPPTPLFPHPAFWLVFFIILLLTTTCFNILSYHSFMISLTTPSIIWNLGGNDDGTFPLLPNPTVNTRDGSIALPLRLNVVRYRLFAPIDFVGNPLFITPSFTNDELTYGEGQAVVGESGVTIIIGNKAYCLNNSVCGINPIARPIIVQGDDDRLLQRCPMLQPSPRPIDQYLICTIPQTAESRQIVPVPGYQPGAAAGNDDDYGAGDDDSVSSDEGGGDGIDYDADLLNGGDTLGRHSDLTLQQLLLSDPVPVWCQPLSLGIWMQPGACPASGTFKYACSEPNEMVISLSDRSEFVICEQPYAGYVNPYGGCVAIEPIRPPTNEPYDQDYTWANNQRDLVYFEFHLPLLVPNFSPTPYFSVGEGSYVPVASTHPFVSSTVTEPFSPTTSTVPVEFLDLCLTYLSRTTCNTASEIECVWDPVQLLCRLVECKDFDQTSLIKDFQFNVTSCLATVDDRAYPRYCQFVPDTEICVVRSDPTPTCQQLYNQRWCETNSRCIWSTTFKQCFETSGSDQARQCLLVANVSSSSETAAQLCKSLYYCLWITTTKECIIRQCAGDYSSTTCNIFNSQCLLYNVYNNNESGDDDSPFDCPTCAWNTTLDGCFPSFDGGTSTYGWKLLTTYPSSCKEICDVGACNEPAMNLFNSNDAMNAISEYLGYTCDHYEIGSRGYDYPFNAIEENGESVSYWCYYNPPDADAPSYCNEPLLTYGYYPICCCADQRCCVNGNCVEPSIPVQRTSGWQLVTTLNDNCSSVCDSHSCNLAAMNLIYTQKDIVAIADSLGYACTTFIQSEEEDSTPYIRKPDAEQIVTCGYTTNQDASVCPNGVATAVEFPICCCSNHKCCVNGKCAGPITTTTSHTTTTTTTTTTATTTTTTTTLLPIGDMTFVAVTEPPGIGATDCSYRILSWMYKLPDSKRVSRQFMSSNNNAYLGFSRLCVNRTANLTPDCSQPDSYAIEFIHYWNVTL